MRACLKQIIISQLVQISISTSPVRCLLVHSLNINVALGWMSVPKSQKTTLYIFPVLGGLWNVLVNFNKQSYKNIIYMTVHYTTIREYFYFFSTQDYHDWRLRLISDSAVIKSL